MKSQARASSQPPPSAKPFTAAMTGTGSASMHVHHPVPERAEVARLRRRSQLGHLGDVRARRRRPSLRRR